MNLELLNIETGTEAGFFGETLLPALLDACEGRVSDVHLFRTDWQRGGALTGYAKWDDHQPAVIKLPVPPRELNWLKRLQNDKHDFDPVVPVVFACGKELGGYDLAWVVMERLPYGPLNAQWDGAEVGLLVEAIARFQAAARVYAVDEKAREEDWDMTLSRSRKTVKELALPEAQRWNVALKAMGKKLKKVLKVWDGRPIEDWCHGDMHLANAMTRVPPEGCSSAEGRAILFDLARVHAGHWTEDAVYFESLFWSAPSRIGGANVGKMLGAARKALGLHNDAKWPRVADMRRALVASAAPAQQTTRPDPGHLHAALGMLEQKLSLL